jgi:hypothetical protein
LQQRAALENRLPARALLHNKDNVDADELLERQPNADPQDRMNLPCD